MKNYIYLFLILNTVIIAADVCDITGVKGFEFGMSEKEALKNNTVTFSYKSYMDAAKHFGTNQREIENLDEKMKKNGMSFLYAFTTAFAGYETEGMLSISTDKGLSNITNSIIIETQNENKYIDAYFEIKELLTKKYGGPTFEVEYLEGIYSSDFPRGTYAAQALSRGLGMYQCRFQCNSEDIKYISLILNGDNGKIKLNLGYSDRTFQESQESKEKKKLDDF